MILILFGVGVVVLNRRNQGQLPPSASTIERPSGPKSGTILAERERAREATRAALRAMGTR